MFARSSVLVSLLALAACGDARDDARSCPDGTLVEAAAGKVCVFRRDSALVIEGGFDCPAQFDFRIDTATSIACSDRAMLELPKEVCAEIAGACDHGREAQSGGASKARVAEVVEERIYGPGECIRACSVTTDCTADLGRADRFEDIVCNAGACENRGHCRNDAECTGYPGTVCRADAAGFRSCVDACESAADCGERANVRGVECVDGGCKVVGCSSDAQCAPAIVCEDQPAGTCDPRVCALGSDGVRGCFAGCETAEDCAARAREEAGLTEPDPGDPWTSADGFVCRHGLCRLKELGCANDADCQAMGPMLSCSLPE